LHYSGKYEKLLENFPFSASGAFLLPTIEVAKGTLDNEIVDTVLESGFPKFHGPVRVLF